MNEKQDRGYLPSEGEHLGAFVNRLKDIAEQTRYDRLPSHEKWYTHYGAGPCWICMYADFVDYLVSMLADINNYDKKGKWTCYRPEKSHDALSFSFKRTLRK